MSEHLITTAAKVVSCPRCRKTVLAGISEGLNAVADITRLASEAQFFADGLPTYNLRRGRLEYREPGRSEPVGGIHTPTVLGTHICPKKPQGELF